MYSYTFLQWLAFFYIYCFIGWCIESTIMSVEAKRFINRGFLRLPMLPIYGFGAIIMLMSGLPFKDTSPVLVYVVSAIASTALELVTGLVMEAIFKVKYWDYTKQEHNYKGVICVQSTLFWGFLALFLNYTLHTRVEKLLFKMSHTALLVTVIIVSVLFVSDIVVSVKAALNTRTLLEALTKAKEELNKLAAETKESIENTERVKAIREKFNAEKQKLLSKMDFIAKSQIRSHPQSYSERFGDALKEIKEYIRTKRTK